MKHMNCYRLAGIRLIMPARKPGGLGCHYSLCIPLPPWCMRYRRCRLIYTL